LTCGCSHGDRVKSSRKFYRCKPVVANNAPYIYEDKKIPLRSFRSKHVFLTILTRAGPEGPESRKEQVEIRSTTACFDLCRVDFVFRMSRAPLLARLPLYCSAECATPTNSSLFADFPRNLANAPLPPESFRTCLVCTTHAHSHFCPQHWLLRHLGFAMEVMSRHVPPCSESASQKRSSRPRRRELGLELILTCKPKCLISFLGSVCAALFFFSAC